MAMLPVLRANALVVHVFVAVNGDQRPADLRYLLGVWQACSKTLGMTEAVAGFTVDPEPGWDAVTGAPSGVLAARTRPGAGVHQAVLRREHDAFCLSIMREPDPAEGLGWVELDQEWAVTVGQPSPGVIGAARLFLTRLADPAAAPAPSAELGSVVQAMAPVNPAATGQWREQGIVVPHGFAVWEASAPLDSRAERRIVVVAGADCDCELSAWAWIDADRALPVFGKYLLHAAKLRYQLRVWEADQGFRQLRQEADTTIRKLLSIVAPVSPQRREPRQAQLVEASKALVSLQARELGLVDRSTRLREMRRSVEIAAANLLALSGDARLGGLFADDRALATWFGQQLDDDATYLEAALHRSKQVNAWTDQLVQRSQQRRQESVNLGLTGVIGAILMSLAAIQSLQYTVPLPALAKPAVVTALGALALFASLVVLRIVVPDRRWSLMLAQAGFGGITATLTWVGVSAIAGLVAPDWTRLWVGVGFLVGTSVAVITTRLRQ
ncbi:MAG: CATRA conflict system CASPASE/TPR repeat-associated protein [Pseudonocardiaceae bacterium]